MGTELVKAGDVAVTPSRAEGPTRLLEVIATAVSDPRMDVEKMERLLAMHQTITTEQRKTAFMAAMARLTPKLPEITQRGRVAFSTNAGGAQSRKYARLEDIDRAIRPLIAEEGFSLSFDTAPLDGQKVRVICRLSHSEGHSELKQIDLPIDSSGSKNATQAVGSTVSYGRRVLTKMFFNLIETGEDDDGSGGSGPITKKQATDIRADLKAVGIDEARFLKFMGAEKVEAILARDYQKASNAIETKRRQNANS